MIIKLKKIIERRITNLKDQRIKNTTQKRNMINKIINSPQVKKKKLQATRKPKENKERTQKQIKLRKNKPPSKENKNQIRRGNKIRTLPPTFNRKESNLGHTPLLKSLKERIYLLNQPNRYRRRKKITLTYNYLLIN